MMDLYYCIEFCLFVYVLSLFISVQVDICSISMESYLEKL